MRMTNEMLHIIVELALTKLIELPPATLRSYEPWLTRTAIRWCLEHLAEWKQETPEYLASCALIQDAAALIRRERALQEVPHGMD